MDDGCRLLDFALKRAAASSSRGWRGGSPRDDAGTRPCGHHPTANRAARVRGARAAPSCAAARGGQTWADNGRPRMHEDLMDAALDQARVARDAGEVPIGAVVSIDGE